MMKRLLFISLYGLLTHVVEAQITTANGFDLPSHTFMKFNRNFINPTFSVYSDRQADFSLLHRNQWYEYDNAIKTYMVSFSGNNFEKTGYGLNVFQQNIGVLKNVGGVGNFVKGIKISDGAMLAFGFNLFVIHSNLDWGTIVIGQPDPLLNQYDGRFLMVLNPGLSLKINHLNVGISADNLVDYNFKNAEMLTAFNKKTYSGHVEYSMKLSENTNIFENSRLTILGKTRYVEMETFDFSGTVQYEVPKIGWLQGSYSDYFGASFGIGLSLRESITLGLNYEKGLDGVISNLGSTYEIVFGYRFGDEQESSIQTRKTKRY